MAGEWHLFEAVGIELEYMIVAESTLDVLPIADELMRAVAGDYVSDVDRGPLAWSNELCLHVLELKTNGPAKSFTPLMELFQQEVCAINGLLAERQARLMPTAMHPWMNPDVEMRLWPHEFNAVYQAFDSIFNCRGHGWANLQSTHVNLPFQGDEEFGRLHAAIRLLLPLLPALAASSPVVEGRAAGRMDQRLHVYRGNARRVPSVSGEVIPEQAFDEATYKREILHRIYRDIVPFDPAGILQDEFLNARGAIARFSRGSIEIRLLDLQECPLADLSICEILVAALRLLVEEHWTGTAEQQALRVAPLQRLLLAAIDQADEALVDEPEFLRQFGLPPQPLTMRELWMHLVDAVAAAASESRTLPEPDASGAEPTDGRLSSGVVSQTALRTVRSILRHGPLSRRILGRLGDDMSHASLQSVYAELCDCLAEGRLLT